MSGASLMQSDRKYDFIIVGQGLAGSALAYRLINRGHRILVYDLPAPNSTSRIAAGLFNPVTGKRMVKTWLADTLFPALHHFYSEVQDNTRANFFHPTTIYRPFLTIEEQNEWMGRSTESGFIPFIERIASTPPWPMVKSPHGGLLLKQGGFLDTRSFIHAIQILIQAKGTLLQEAFDASRLDASGEEVRYNGFTAKKLIFCTGIHLTGWFDWLPIRPLKGETLQIRSRFTDRVIINRGVYMVPLAEHGTWRVGSTYQFHDRSEVITESARVELESRIQELLSAPFEVISQEWGMRPTTPDHRPLLGRHPETGNVFIFNGLGTKGVSLAPYFSEVLVQVLENRIALDKEIDIDRYKSLYSGSPS